MQHGFQPTPAGMLAAGVRALGRRAAAVHVLFNNCYEDYAQRNALQFLRLV